jgi:general secretion pathway protein D
VALAAAANDNNATVIQRPRIQTSQAKAASFFVGQTVPYVTGNSYGSTYGNSASYSQLSVGVELDVTPFINPDGLVVMDINQSIDELNGYTPILNVGNVPNTIKRQLSSEIAVRDRDTIMLGGFIRSEKSKTKNGVPLLEDIPLLGYLFSSHTDSKKRSETVVLIRPTVLKTPELAAAQAVKEQERLPGISAAIAEDTTYEHKQIETQRKAELKRAEAEQKRTNDTRTWLQRHAPLKHDRAQGDRLNPVSPDDSVDTNAVAVPNP